MDIFKTPKYIAAALAISLLTWGCYKVYDHYRTYIELREKIVDMTHEAEEFARSIATLERAAQQARMAREVADAARRRAEELLDRTRRIEDEIDQSSEADDGPVAPVLRNTLDALRGLR